jgi:hypothetical protein
MGSLVASLTAKAGEPALSCGGCGVGVCGWLKWETPQPGVGWGVSTLMVVRRCPTLPHPPGCSTIGAVGLSFRVRNGTGRFPHAMTAVTLLPVPPRGGGGWEDCGYNCGAWLLFCCVGSGNPGTGCCSGTT